MEALAYTHMRTHTRRHTRTHVTTYIYMLLISIFIYFHVLTTLPRVSFENIRGPTFHHLPGSDARNSLVHKEALPRMAGENLPQRYSR